MWTINHYLRKETNLPQSERHLVDYVDIVSCGFVIHAPTPVDELETTLVDKLLDGRFHFVGLFSPPAREEGHLDVYESVLFSLTSSIHQKFYLGTVYRGDL